MVRTLLVLLASVLIAAQSAAAELEMVRITHATGSFESLPVSYALAAGYFEAEGLDVESVPSLGVGQDLAELDGGEVQFNLGGAGHQIGALIAERPILNVYNIYRHSLTGLVISIEAAKQSGIAAGAPLADRVRALRSLRIGVNRNDSSVDRQLRHLLRISGVEGEVEILPLGKPADMLVALEAGTVDGVAISVPHDRLAVTRGLGEMWIDMAAGSAPSIDPLIHQSLITSPQFARQHPETVRAMVGALQRAIDDIQSKPAEEIRDMVQPAFGKLSPAVVLSGIEAAKPALDRTGAVTLEMAANSVRLDSRNGITAEQLFSIYTDEFR